MLLLLERSLPRKTAGVATAESGLYGPLNQLPGRYRGHGIIQKNGCRYKSKQWLNANHIVLLEILRSLNQAHGAQAGLLDGSG